MGINQVQEAVDRYEKTVKQAAADYENTLRAAEAELRGALVTVDVSEPPASNMVQMSRSDYDQVQNQLKVVAKFIEEHPELKVGV